MGQDDQVFSLKFTSSDPDSNIYIIGSFLLDPAVGKSLGQEIVASSVASIVNIQISSSFKEFASRIQNIVYQGQSLKNVTKNLSDHLKKSLGNDGFLEEILHYVERNESAKIIYLIETIVNKAAGLGSPKINLAIDRISKSSVSPSNPSEVGNSNPNEANSLNTDMSAGPSDIGNAVLDIPPDARMVQCKLLLSPVSGVPVSSLTYGSKIVVRLHPADEITKEMIVTMNLKNEDGIINPILGQIQKITHTGAISEIIIKINENVYSKLTEEVNSVKVRVSLPDLKQNRNSPSDIEKNIEALKNDNSIFFYAIGIAGILAFGIMIIIFLI
jgi:hypothetical protein